MPSNNFNVGYELFEDKRAIKFMDKHSDDEKLLRRIYNKYHLLACDPYDEAESSFKSRKCPNVKKQEWETIELYISSRNQLKRLK